MTRLSDNQRLHPPTKTFDNRLCLSARGAQRALLYARRSLHQDPVPRKSAEERIIARREPGNVRIAVSFGFSSGVDAITCGIREHKISGPRRVA